MGNNQAAMDAFKAAVDSGDMRQMAQAQKDWSTDDYVQEWPQSGERVVGRDAANKLNESYPQATGTMPKMTLRRMTGAGDIYVIEGTIDYGDGTPVSYIGIAEFRDGKVAKMTEYFANPFEAPAWRKDLVERMDPVSV